MESPPDALDEPDLIARAQDGDRPAFAQLADQYWDRLYKWLYHVSHDRHLAEDLAQESFLRAFAALGNFNPGTNFRAWLFRIAYNAFLNQRRGRVRVREKLPLDLSSPGADPLELALGREALSELTRALGRLRQEVRAAFLLRVEEGLSFREIAEVLALTEETARWRVFKAREKLMKLLGPYLREDKP